MKTMSNQKPEVGQQRLVSLRLQVLQRGVGMVTNTVEKIAENLAPARVRELESQTDPHPYGLKVHAWIEG